MIWKRIKKSTPEQEERFRKQQEEMKVTPKEKLIMVLTAYAMLVLPCLLVLVGLSLFLLWIMGLL